MRRWRSWRSTCVYENVGLPTVHGRERVRRLFGRAYGSGGGFDVVIHTICADGPSVLTERTDFLTFRKLHMELWVCGRFDVRDGQIVLWRDYFDFLKFNSGSLARAAGSGSAQAARQAAFEGLISWARCPAAVVRRIEEHHGEWRSLVAHPAGGRAVAGSNPVSPMSKRPVLTGLLHVYGASRASFGVQFGVQC